MTVLKHSK